MSDRRDHRPRFNSWCPDLEGCARLFHGTLGSGVEPGDTCECCGQTYEGEPPTPAPSTSSTTGRP